MGSLRELQERFTAHIRNPDHNPGPEGVEDRRLAIYRDLFFRNLSNFIAKSFPVVRKLYDDDAWDAFMREFYATHEFHTPLFPEIPREFLQYLQEGRDQRDDDPPFLLELAHYEWVEIALDLDEQDLDAVPADPDGNLLEGVPVLSPLAWPLAYNYPVHKIRPSFQPEAPSEAPTFLLVYRNRDDEVKFMELNAVTSRVVNLLKEDVGKTGLDVLNAVVAELNHPRPETLLEAGAEVLRDLAERDVILGTQQQ
ncbi:MAG: putative DNA-binding domain-containing protein [Pseudomonadota bacterium]